MGTRTRNDVSLFTNPTIRPWFQYLLRANETYDLQAAEDPMGSLANVLFTIGFNIQ